jgi:hypothetical protein
MNVPNLCRAAMLIVALSMCSTAHAGRFPVSGTEEFTYPNGTTTFSGATLSSTFNGVFSKVQDNALQMANKSSPGNSGSLRIDDLDPGSAIQAFDATFTARMEKSGTAQPGTGWALNFGPVPGTGNGSGEMGFAMDGGLVISFDTYANSENDPPSIEVISNNVSVGNFPVSNLTETAPVTSGNFTLTNPAATTGDLTTRNISYSSSAASVRLSMRRVTGWENVTVTGGSGTWVVTMGSPGNLPDPVGDGSGLSGSSFAPGEGKVTVINTQDGTATLPEIWTISIGGRGFIYDASYRPVVCHWDYSGLDLSYNGQVVFTDLPTPGFSPADGNAFAFTTSAGLGGAGSQDTYIDDLLLTTEVAIPFEPGTPIISEFMAENKSILEDEDMDTPDWIEIYNGKNSTTNLSGYKLSDGVFTWTFPSVSVPALGHLVVYASGKNRTSDLTLLHTNFTLPKSGGTLTLLNPTDTVLSSWTYPSQSEDISYGIRYQGAASGFLGQSSPGAATQHDFEVAPNGPAEDVVWSRPGGIISGDTDISVAAPVAAGSVIRYSTDNGKPSVGSPVFPATLTVGSSTNVRARVFTPGHLSGRVTSRSFLLIDSSLSNYNNSGQPFKSHLPLIVFDSFGVNVDAVTNSAQARPHRYTYGVVIDKDPTTGFADITSAVTDFQGRGGTHVRGDSSSGFAQKSYAWETWDNNDEDKDASFLGMPADSDWVLHGPYTDKTFFRNLITFQKMRELHGDENGHAMRTTLVEVIFNQGANQPVSYSDYRGVYVLMERIKRGNNRIDIAKLNNLAKDPALISGGYIFRRDRTSADGNTPLPVGMHSHTPNILNSAQTTWLTDYLNAFNNALNGGNFTHPTLGYAPYIDVDSFIEQWWFVEIMKQIDGYRLSTYFHKDRGGKIVASPLWDYNLSLGNANYLFGDQYAGWYWNQTDTYWWARLRQDPNYEIRHWDRYWEMRRTIFETGSILSFIDDLKSEVVNGSATAVTNDMSLPSGQPSTNENAAMRHYRKYQVLGNYLWPNAGGDPGQSATLSPRPWQANTTFQSEVDWMKNWLSQRLNWIDDQNFSGNVIFRPPNFSISSGNINAGTQLTISRYTGSAPGGYSYASGGTLYYTLDGTDPRTSAGSRRVYTTPLTLTNSSNIQSRLLRNGVWSPITTASFIVDAAPASAANLVISEIHYHPLDPSTAELNAGYNSSGEFEFIELQNVSAGNVDLSNCRFTDGITYDFGDQDPVALTLAPGGRVILVGNQAAFTLRYGSVSNILGEFIGSLNNSGETVTLLAANDDIIASITYGDDEPWPVDADTNGYSLVLNNPAAGANYNSGNSWRSSATVGGSPGTANSIPFTGSLTGDTDSDGLKDILEYAMGTAWNDSGEFPQLEISQNMIQFRQNLAADGVTLNPQMSTDLANWSSAGLSYMSTVNMGDGTALVTYELDMSGNKGFVHVVAELTDGM